MTNPFDHMSLNDFDSAFPVEFFYRKTSFFLWNKHFPETKFKPRPSYVEVTILQADKIVQILWE